jgi:hypothetical protein
LIQIFAHNSNTDASFYIWYNCFYNFVIFILKIQILDEILNILLWGCTDFLFYF